MISSPFCKWNVSTVTGGNATKFECMSAALSLSICQEKKEKGHLRLGRNFIHKVGGNKLFLSCTTEKMKATMEDISNCYHKLEFRLLKN